MQELFDYWYAFERFAHDPTAPVPRVPRTGARPSVDAAIELCARMTAVAIERDPQKTRPALRALIDGLDDDPPQRARLEPSRPPSHPRADDAPVPSAAPTVSDWLAFWHHFRSLAHDPLAIQHLYAIRESVFRPLDARTRHAIERRMLESPAVRALYKRRPQLAAAYDLGALRRLPSGTLGSSFARFIDDRGLDPAVHPPLTRRGPLAFMNHRIRKTHDIHHVLTGFETDVPGETGILGFYIAQMGTPAALALLSALLLSVALAPSLGGNDAQGAMRLFDRCLRRVRAGYRMGLTAAPLSCVLWEAHWATPLPELRARYGIDAERAHQKEAS